MKSLKMTLSAFALVAASTAMAKSPARECLPVETPNFKAERVERNPVSGRYQIYKPYYLDESRGKRYTLSSEHGIPSKICEFFGFKFGRVLDINPQSSVTMNDVVVIQGDGSYYFHNDYDGTWNGQVTILECN